MTIPFPLVRATNSYDLTLQEVKAIRDALLYMRAHDATVMTGLTVDQIVALENALIWRV
jgi:hypothetical protein